MIDGVKVKKIITHCDDRGYFREVLRDDDDIAAKFGQISTSLAYPGVIKAFHWHYKQDDQWYFAAGNAQVVLYDRRPDSPTQGQTDTFILGDNNPIMVHIPVGVAHGYRVLGNQPAILVYHTTNSYNPDDPDEERIAHDDPEIGFDWSTKPR